MTTSPAQPWPIKTMTGTYMRHNLIVVNPACPEGRHPTRDCGCKVFAKQADAQRYAREKGAEAP